MRILVDDLSKVVAVVVVVIVLASVAFPNVAFFATPRFKTITAELTINLEANKVV